MLKSAEEISLMRRAGKLVARLLEELSRGVRPGLKTEELDRVVEEEVARLGVKATFKGYHGFPANLCVSVNEEVVHGIPGDRKLESGDIVSLDLGVTVDGYQADGAITIGVGPITPLAQRLIQVTQKALEQGISQARKGRRLGDMSFAIQEYVEGQGFSVVREYAGHGIGRELHEDPQVPNFGPPSKGPRLLPKMTLAIEPMVNVGGWRTRVAANGWTVVTDDGSLSAHFEHTIALTDGEPEVLTAV